MCPGAKWHRRPRRVRGPSPPRRSCPHRIGSAKANGPSPCQKPVWLLVGYREGVETARHGMTTIDHLDAEPFERSVRGILAAQHLEIRTLRGIQGQGVVEVQKPTAALDEANNSHAAARVSSRRNRTSHRRQDVAGHRERSPATARAPGSPPTRHSRPPRNAARRPLPRTPDVDPPG